MPVTFKTSVIEAPVPGFVFPLAPVAVEVHPNVFIPDNEELKVIFTGVPLQTVSLVDKKLTLGKGLTLTRACLTSEEQPFKEETTEKVALWVKLVVLVYNCELVTPVPLIAPTLLVPTVQEINEPDGAAP